MQRPLELGLKEAIVLREIEQAGSCIVSHGSLPARAGRGGYPVMVYTDGGLACWRRAYLVDRLYNQGILDLHRVWCPVTRDWDVLYVRTWEEPIDVDYIRGIDFEWHYTRASTNKILSFALASLEAYNAVANIAEVAANARNYCVKEKEDAEGEEPQEEEAEGDQEDPAGASAACAKEYGEGSPPSERGAPRGGSVE